MTHFPPRPANYPPIDTSNVLLAVSMGARTSGQLAAVFGIHYGDTAAVAVLYAAVGALIRLKDVRWGEVYDEDGCQPLLLPSEDRVPHDDLRRKPRPHHPER